MRKYNGKELISRIYNNKIIIMTKLGVKTIWQSIRSCFGAGYWIGEKPWIGEEAWKGE